MGFLRGTFASVLAILSVNTLSSRSAEWAMASPVGQTNRRLALFGVIAASSQMEASPATAFENRLGSVNQKAKPGKPPSNLGANVRKPGALPDLTGCGVNPNCFSSAATSENNTFRFDKDVERQHYVKPWRYESGGAKAAFDDCLQAVKNYVPGQRGIDGGGFGVKTSSEERGYIYAEFESLLAAYRDDLELLVRPDSEGSAAGEVRVRSASRQGQLDSGVNAKRLNGIAEKLVAIDGKKWTAPTITNDMYPEYVKANR